MSVPVGSDAPSPPAPAPEPGPDRSPAPAHLVVRELTAAICPYLASEGGAWRSAAPSRDHRCTAVEPAVAQPTEKQRRHCLSADHVECPLYRAARTARAVSLAAGADPQSVDAADRRRRAVARTAPVVLEAPRLVDQAMRLQFDRAPGQIALVGLMLVAFAVVAIARFSAGAPGPSASPGPSAVAVASPTPRPTPTATPIPSISASIGPSPSVSPAPSFRTTYTVKRGDTLIGIASKFKTTAAKIRALNGMPNNSLKVGQVLKIP
jgi:nucleoid-associated protein YgaU